MPAVTGAAGTSSKPSSMRDPNVLRVTKVKYAQPLLVSNQKENIPPQF